MKFSGSGSTALHDLKKYLRRNGKLNPLPRRKSKPALEKPSYSKWVMKIRARIERDLDLDAIRVFPIDRNMVYRPDYLLSHMRDGKKTIVQIDEIITSSAVARYKSFMKEFGSVYFVIAIVHDGQLRQWNEIDQDQKILFDEIWVGEDMSDMVNRIKNPPKIVNHIAICSTCNIKADNLVKIKRDFPYQIKDGSVEAHSQCRRCKKAREAVKTKPTLRTSHKCIGCGFVFSTQIASCLYCDKCSQKLNS